MSSPQIKICGITSSTMLDACIAAGATHIGLVFYARSPRHIEFDKAAALAERANRRVMIVGLFVDPENDIIDEARRQVRLDAIQLHGNERPALVANIRSRNGIEVWKAIGIRKSEDFTAARRHMGAADRILYDAKPPEGAPLPGGTGLRIDWSLFNGQRHSLPWILAGGLDAQNVKTAIGATGARFVDTSSGVESAPGIKDASKIAAFCAAAHAG